MCVSACGTSCTGATSISGTGGRFTGSTSGSSAYTGSCGGGSAPERTYTFTLSAASDVFITTHGSAFNTVLYVRSCNCTGTEVACNDNADGFNTSMLQLTNLAAGTYTVFVDGNGTATGSYTLDVYITPTGAVAGDRCSRPTFWPGGTANVTGSTCGLADDMNAEVTGCFVSSGIAPDAVYYFVVTANSTVTIDTCSAGCTDYDTVLTIRSICNNATVTACNDDACKSGCVAGGMSRQSNVSASLAPGIYYVAVDGYASACGNYSAHHVGF